MPWTENNNALHASFDFKDFVSAWGFLTEIAIIAEKMNHHPSWSNTYNMVDIRLCTHDAGDTITDKDRELAKKILDVYEKFRV